MIQRWEFEVCNEYASSCDAMKKDPDGDYVKCEDCATLERKYQALWRECEALAKENKKYRDALQRIANMGTLGIMEIAQEALEGGNDPEI